MRAARFLGFVLVLAGTVGLVAASAFAPGELRVPQDCKTIQECITKANPGDTILIDPGTYVENLTITKREIAIRGTDPEKVIVQAKFADEPVVLLRERDVRLSALTLSGGVRGLQIESRADNPTLSRLILRGNRNEGLFVEGVRGGELRESLLTQNGKGAFVGNRAQFRLQGNRIAENQDGVEALDVNRLELRENSIVNNRSCGLRADVASADPTVLIGRDNVILGNSQDLCDAAQNRRDLLDQTPPAAPRNLTVTPTDWTNQQQFVIDWESPPDIAGIAAYYFKVGAAPRSATDGTRREIAQKPLVIENPPEGEQAVFIWLEDGMGNKDHKNRGQVILRFDKTPPEIHILLDPSTPNGQNGWYTKPVKVTYQCRDALSGLDPQPPCPPAATLSSDGIHQLSLGPIRDLAGNVAGPLTAEVKLDQTPPKVDCRPPDPSRWYREDVTVPCTAQDATSGLASSSDASFTLTARGEGEAVSTGTRTIADRAGNSVTVGPFTFKVDKTPPTITAQPRRPPDANGWYNRDVTVDFKCDDRLSGIASCTPPITVSREGRDQVVQGEAVDRVGNRATATAKISLDKTPPTGSLTINDGAAETNSNIVTLRIQANDNLSGVSQMRFSNDGRTWNNWESFSSTRSNWDLSRFGGQVGTMGTKTVYAQVRDRAGNESQAFSATIRFSYTVCATGCLYSSITAAITAARAGDTITIGPGTYQENLTITKSLTLQGTDRERTTIQGILNQQPVILVQSARLTLQNLKVTGGKGQDPDWRGDGILATDQAQLEVMNSLILGNDARGIKIVSAQADITNSEISDNGLWGIHITSNARATISDSVIDRNVGIGILVGLSFGEAEIMNNRIRNTKSTADIPLGDGIEVLDDSRATIKGNTITGNARHGLFVGGGYLFSDPSQRFRSSTSTIEENTISNNGWNGILIWASTAAINRNIIQENQGCGVEAGDDPTITGRGNVISSNRGGNLCPPPGQFPWPQGFGGGA